MIGRTISQYRILEKLGEGGMGVVYKAQDTKLDRLVALKFLPSHTSIGEVEELRLVQEAKAAAALNHQNVCSVIDLRQEDGQQFIVMEFVDGKTLRNVMPVVVDQAITYGLQIGDALREAHCKGIVHRDIKSENIMVNARGQVKVMDFGLAKLKGSLRLTKEMNTTGTLAYMAPEVIQGGESDARSDIFSFGIVLSEMLTGRLPFRGEHDASIMYSVLNEEPEPVRKYVPDAPDRLVHMLNRALQKNPDNRYQSMDEVLSDLHALQKEKQGSGSVSSTATESKTKPSRKPLNRRWAMIAASVLAIFSIILFSPARKFIQHLIGSGGVPEQQHLLVLPFEFVGSDASKQPLCDGLVETMTSKLTQMEQFHQLLWVVPASEARRSNIQSPSDAHRYFGANLAVTGSLQLLGDIFRLTLNLVDAKRLRQLSSAVIDVNSGNLPALQNECVGKLLAMLNHELKPPAREVLEAGTTTVPDAYEFYLCGMGYLQRYEDEKNLDAAIDVFTKAIARDSMYALAHAGLSNAYWRKYEAGKEIHFVSLASEESEKAYRINPKLPEAIITRGMIYAGTGEHEKALDAFNRAMDLDATNVSAYSGLAKEYEAKGMLQQAEATYQKAIALKPDYWGGYNSIGVFYFKQGRYEDAIREFRHIVELTPDNDRGYTNLGGVYYMLKQWKEAREMFERSLSIRKTYRVCSNLGTLYYIEGDYAKASQMYRSALEINDKDYRVWGNLAAAHYWTPNDRARSGDAYRRAIMLAEKQRDINKKDPDLLTQLGGYYSMIGEKQKTLAFINEAVALSSDNAEIMSRVSAAYEQLGDRDRALDWIEKALKKGYPLTEIKNQPELRSLIEDKRFRTITAMQKENTERHN